MELIALSHDVVIQVITRALFLLFAYHLFFYLSKGEDGFEISVPTNKAVALATTFLNIDTGSEGIKPTGLGARDSLRLEAGTLVHLSIILANRYVKDCACTVTTSMKTFHPLRELLHG